MQYLPLVAAQDLSLIATVAAGFAGAWLLGLLAQWLRLSPIVGYLLAGVLIGPHTPGFVGDLDIAHQLAEVGVILLMFGVGLHFHLKDLLAVRSVAIPGAVGQSVIATVVAMGLFSLFGMPLTTGAVLGMAMAVASTVVLMRVLMDANVMNAPQGHVAVGWLIVEDIFTVILLVVIPVLGQEVDAPAAAAGAAAAAQPLWMTLGIALLKLAVLSFIVLWGGARVVPWVLVRVARLRSRELFTLTVLVFSIAVAAASYFFFGASMALGAFLAGMVVAQSPVSHQAAADALPMRDAFAVLFFVSVGMLFDPAFLLEQPLMVLAALVVILIAKPLAALIIVAVLGHSVRTALTVAIGLAQIGEFSFILSDLAKRYGLMPDSGHNVLVASAIISITLNPLLFKSLPKFEAWLKGRPVLWKLLNGRAEKRALASLKQPEEQEAVSRTEARRAVVVGYGPVGRSVHQVLREAGLHTVIIDFNMDTVAALRASGVTAIFGDASNEGILEQAGAEEASHLVITLPDAAQRAAIVTAARNLSPTLRVFVRARYLREREELERSGVTSAIFEEAEAAVALARLVLTDTGLHREAAERKLKDIRLQLVTENLNNLHTQRVVTVMVPWARVNTLSSAADLAQAREKVAQQRYSRWPVVEHQTRQPLGYVLTRELVSGQGGEDWKSLIRPMGFVSPHDSVQAALAQLRESDEDMCVVRDGATVLGIVTQRDILEQVVGRLEDDRRRDTPVSLYEAVTWGAIVNPLEATTRDQSIRELVAALPRERIPAGMDVESIAALAIAREEEISTDLGNGIGLPHARCPGLEAPVVVIGQSPDGVVFSTSPEGGDLVHLLFLLLTPAERPETQLALLSQVAKLAGTESARSALFHAASPVELLEILQDQAKALEEARKKPKEPGKAKK